ncbi:hypothetical protein [Candidatus Nanohalococcus occultus]|uniref:hypothetical protein n=1 Tax=Candidatus Nanohalococcus occultus TaxID=2978047 RepID=UPI0039E00AE3
MLKERFKQLKNLEKAVEELNRDLDGIIVEGFSDKRAMRKLGFEGKIFQSAERSIEDLTEDVARGTRKVAVLTDYDSHGRKEAEKITHALQGRTDILISARKKFGEVLTYNDRHAIEDVEPLFSSWEDKFVDAALDRL